MMKIATEDEALTHDDVTERFEAFAPVVTVEVKIGGPGARGDLELCRRLGIRHVIAPMIESSYGLRDYLAAADEIRSPGRGGWRLGINIETAGAVARVESILDADADRRLSQVTVGRGDLSKSLGVSPDDPSVTRRTRKVVAAARARGYAAGVGGGIDPGNVIEVLERIAPDGFNTRNFAFAANGWKTDEARSAVRAALEIEIEILRIADGQLAARRIAALRARLKRG
jgi:citrate lyase beta subunit